MPDIPLVALGGTDGTGLLKTSDGGATWYAPAARSFPYGEAIAFRDSLDGLIAGRNGEILITEDGGSTWTEQFCAAPRPMVGKQAQPLVQSGPGRAQ